MDADGEPNRLFTIGFRSPVQDRLAQLAQHRDTASASAWKLCVVPTYNPTLPRARPVGWGAYYLFRTSPAFALKSEVAMGRSQQSRNLAVDETGTLTKPRSGLTKPEIWLVSGDDRGAWLRLPVL